MKIPIFFLLSFLSPSAYASAPAPWEIYLQNPASPIMERLYFFHDFLLAITFGIVLVVFGLLAYVALRFNAKANPTPAKFSHNILIEIIWTIIPIIILVIIAVPSFKILKFEEEFPEAELTIKVAGYQWYWNYTYPDHGNFSFDSYMVPDSELKPGQKRLLEVDNRLVIPENTVVKFLITGADVIHSFAVPALGIKMDGVPGRVNETWTKVSKKGIYYGQCSELCGVNHGFMPIALEVVGKDEFEAWVGVAKNKFALGTKRKGGGFNFSYLNK